MNENRSSFQNVVFSSEYQMLAKDHKPSSLKLLLQINMMYEYLDIKAGFTE
jgi:hypothetical protein